VRFDADAGEDAAYWRSLLGGSPVELDGDVAVPPASYVAGERWERLLTEAPATSLTHYQRAVMAHARGDLRAAVDGYEASLRQRRSAWAMRGLGLALIASGETDAGLSHLADALSLAPELAPLALELGEALLDAERASEARGLVDAQPAEVRALGRFRALAVRAALALGDRDEAGRLLEDEFDVPDIREGELSMSDLWRAAFGDRPVPERYDFTMH
jgi:tetratricopeptide (TPR) repeat protein